MNKIEQKRKELTECFVCELDKNNNAKWTHKEVLQEKLEGFNLGVKMQKEEFQDKIQKRVNYIREQKKEGKMDSSNWEADEYELDIIIKELKSELEVKE